MWGGGARLCVLWALQVLCASEGDEPRFTELLRGWIADGALPDFETFSAEPEKKRRKRKAKYRREASEAKKMKMDSEDPSKQPKQQFVQSGFYLGRGSPQMVVTCWPWSERGSRRGKRKWTVFSINWSRSMPVVAASQRSVGREELQQ